jgi:hypothetical protein
VSISTHDLHEDVSVQRFQVLSEKALAEAIRLANQSLCPSGPCNVGVVYDLLEGLQRDRSVDLGLDKVISYLLLPAPSYEVSKHRPIGIIGCLNPVVMLKDRQLGDGCP